MPNRILRDWTDSEKIDELTVHAERFFIRLIMKVDDYGRYNANPKYLKSTLFPLKSDVTDSDIITWLESCKSQGLIILYAVKGKSYLQIENFKQVLRQKVVKYPSPEDSDGCYADAMQTTINCDAIASLNRIESEVESEVESEEKIAPKISDSSISSQPELKTEKEEKEKSSAKKEKEIPAWEDFEAEGLKLEPNVNLVSLKAKFQSWVENGWKDGHGNKIKNWRLKIANTIGYLPKVNPQFQKPQILSSFDQKQKACDEVMEYFKNELDATRS